MSDLSNRRGAGLDRYDVAELRYAMTKPTQEQLSHIQALGKEDGLEERSDSGRA